MLSVIKLIVYAYDWITYPFYYCIQKPWIARERAAGIRATQVIPGDPNSPWVRVESLSDPANGLDLSKFKSINEAFRDAIRRFGDRKCFGYREILREELQTTTDGKTLKKVVLGDYKWITYSDYDTRVENIARG